MMLSIIGALAIAAGAAACVYMPGVLTLTALRFVYARLLAGMAALIVALIVLGICAL